MIPILVSPPGVEPVSVAQARDYLRLDDTNEDGLLASLIVAARLLVESTTRRVLIRQDWRLSLHNAPSQQCVRLPLAPVTEVLAVTVRGTGGVETVLGSSRYRLNAHSEPPTIVFPFGLPEASQGLSIDLRAGYGPAAADAPAEAVQAILMLVAHWFENRGDTASPHGAQLPPDVALLLGPLRRVRLS